ncbi:MAG: hypothetical protein J1E37_07475 [Prevotella sp.]|nr:hypothetical protein [Prevotella sp.]
MTRRKVINRTGIERRANLDIKTVYVSYVCVKCHTQNIVNVGYEMLLPTNAYNTCQWACKECGYVHSKTSDLPLEWGNTWDDEYLAAEAPQCQNFWKSFFMIATENPKAYWKQCNVCGRILPSSAFARHKGWGTLEKQMECRACKGAINAVLNGKRTSEQLRESSLRRRIGDLFTAQNSKLDVKALFERFGGKCFKTNVPLDINKPSEWHIDHILPSKYFYPLTEDNACLLSREANENKKAQWPSQYYNAEELVRLSKITGANLELLTNPEPIVNTNIDVNAALEKWTQVRNVSDINRRLAEFKKVIIENGLENLLTDKNKLVLGITS